MRRTLLTLTATAAIVAATASVAFADEQSFPFTGFDEVHTSAGIDVVLKQGPFSVRAEGSNEGLERLKIEQDGDKLIVARRRGSNWRSGGKVVVTVTAPDFSSLAASSGSDVEGSTLALRDVAISVSSGADVALSGECAALTVSVSSGSNFEGQHLKCQTVAATASSGSDANVWATRSVTGSASSGADIDIHGSPASVDKSTSSGGSIRAL